MDIYELIIDFIKEIGKYDEFHVQIFDRQCHDCFHRFKLLDEEYKNDFYMELKNHFSNQKNMLQSYRTFDSCSKRSLEIYNSAINLKTYKEFELSVNIFDLKLKNKNYKKEISKLKKSNKKYAKEIDDLKNSKSWKMTKLFRR
jgi:hypothetical protein